jgi:stalled ribosome rescue protein Dom34
MKATVVWVDKEQAKLFHLTEEKMERESIRAPGHPNHHTHGKDQLKDSQQDRRLFSEVANKIKGSTSILILGPGVAKHHFRNYLAEHQPALSRKVVGCETVDHPTDAQIAALARKFFWASATSNSA